MNVSSCPTQCNLEDVQKAGDCTIMCSSCDYADMYLHIFSLMKSHFVMCISSKSNVVYMLKIFSSFLQQEK